MEIRKLPMKKVYEEISARLGAVENCKKSGDIEWEIKHNKALELLFNTFNYSNFELDIDNSNSEKIVLNWSYPCYSEHGYFDGDIELKITITASLHYGIDIKIQNSPFNQHLYRKYFKWNNDYFYDEIDQFLMQKFYYEIQNNNYKIIPIN